MRKIFIFFLLLYGWPVLAQTPSLSSRIAATIMQTWKDSFALDGKPAKWTYDMGVVLKGIEGVWMSTGDGAYFNYLQRQIDFFVNTDGTIKTYKQDDYNLDNINNGKQLLLLYRVTLKDKYLKAARFLRAQLQQQPRTQEGAFWHKKIYPNQQWLDGLYMQAPFYAEYAMLAHEDTAFTDIANQFLLAEKNTLDSSTGLLYHAYDASRLMKWSIENRGRSPLVWARALGWYCSALVDALEYFPQDHPQRASLILLVTRLANAIQKQQDLKTGLWKDVLAYNGPEASKNYFEASASSQFVYFLAKAVRRGYLPSIYKSVFQRGYAGIVEHFIRESNSQVQLGGTVKVSGLGGNPYRDGSFSYYMSEPVIVNDPKGLGAFLIAANEVELHAANGLGKGKIVLMDNYFNRETKVDGFGNEVIFHYKWDEKDNGGFYFLGHLFDRYGAQVKLLSQAPTLENLSKASIFFIVDPDWPKENKHPNYIEQTHIEVLVQYVKKGGILVLMANDSNNVEFINYNKLASQFGIVWNQNMRHDVIADQFDQGMLKIPSGNPIFKSGRSVFIKQFCTQTIKYPAYSVLAENNEVVISVSKVGKGMVFAVGDPWFYNEYVDGRKLPRQYENYAAATEFVQWLLKNVK